MMKMRNIFRGGVSHQRLLLALAILVLVLCVSVLKYPQGEVNYRNSNATWHTLYTVECYRQTPARVHKFLPLVTLGKPTDKGIPWGATLPDGEGNYYYTSFSGAGFFLPYLFFRIFRLPVCEGSLFVLNTVLLCASALFLAWLILYLYREWRYCWLLALLAVFACITAPEILHGMGITYWHQSILQATLPLQLYAFARRRDSALFELLFLLLCLVNPFVEWTGYLANVGFALAELFSGGKLWDRLKNCALTGLVTLASFDLFCLHFLSTVDAGWFFKLLIARFTVRSFSSSDPVSALLKGYLGSFGWLFVLLAVLFVLDAFLYRGFAWRKNSVLLNRPAILFVSAFPVLENFVMKQHAVEYTYDRMKLVFPLCLILCDLVYLAACRLTRKQLAAGALTVLVGVAGLLNLVSYKRDTSYVWPAEYRIGSTVMRDFVKTNYSDALYGIPGGARPYLNLLYDSSLCEDTTPELLSEEAAERGYDHAVYLDYVDDPALVIGLYRFDIAVVTDLRTGQQRTFRVRNGQVFEE